MKKPMLILSILILMVGVACGGESAPIATEPPPTVAAVVDQTIPPTEIPSTVAAPVELEPTAEPEIEPYDFYGPYREPDVQTILATGKPQFINSYADW